MSVLTISGLQLLHCGNLEADDGFFLRGGGTSTASNPNPPSSRRKLVVISVLIEHPTEGLILFETGAGYPISLLCLRHSNCLQLVERTILKSGARR